MKSNKAKEVLDNAYTSIYNTVWKDKAIEAIELAEQELEEEYLKQREGLTRLYELSINNNEEINRVHNTKLRTNILKAFKLSCDSYNESNSYNEGYCSSKHTECSMECTYALLFTSYVDNIIAGESI